MLVVQWNDIWLLVQDGLISIVTTCSLRVYTGAIHTIAASPDESPLVIESLL